MPDPSKFKSQKSFMESCVPTVVKEGKDNKQAVAQCLSMWKNRKSKSFLQRLKELLENKDE